MIEFGRTVDKDTIKAEFELRTGRRHTWIDIGSPTVNLVSTSSDNQMEINSSLGDWPPVSSTRSGTSKRFLWD